MKDTWLNLCKTPSAKVYVGTEKYPYIGNCIFWLVSQILLMLIKSTHAAGGQGTPKRSAHFWEPGGKTLLCLAGVCQGARAEHIFVPYQSWDQIRISTHSQPTSYGIRLGALCLQPTITQQQVRESHHPHQTPRYVLSVQGGVESGQAPRSGLPGLGVCTRGFEKDGAVISVVNLIR